MNFREIAHLNSTNSSDCMFLSDVHQIIAIHFTIFTQTIVLHFRVNRTSYCTHIMHEIPFLETFSTDTIHVFVVMFVDVGICTSKFTHGILDRWILRTLPANSVAVEVSNVCTRSLASGCGNTVGIGPGVRTSPYAW